MSDRYVWSGATGAANGTSWADAFLTVQDAAAVDTAGDVIYVAHDHVEETAAHIAWAWASTGYTDATRTTILCVNRTTGDIANGAVVRTVGTFSLNPHSVGASNYIRGIRFEGSVGGISGLSAGRSIPLGQAGQGRGIIFKDCRFHLKSTVATSIGANGNLPAKWEDCWFNSDNAGGFISATAQVFQWDGGGIEAGCASTILMNFSNVHGSGALFSNLDISGAITGLSVFATNSSLGTTARIQNSRLPSGWNGSLVNSSIGLGSRFAMYNCDDGATNYRLWIAELAGNIRDETGIYRTDGAQIGDTPLSWKMEASSSANYPNIPLTTDPIMVWVEQSATPVTISVEVAQDSGSALLTNKDIWTTVSFPNSAANPLFDSADNRVPTVLTTPTDQPTSSAAWTGVATPVRQKLSVTFVPAMAGVVALRVQLAKPSTTVYVCPKVDLT